MNAATSVMPHTPPVSDALAWIGGLLLAIIPATACWSLPPSCHWRSRQRLGGWDDLAYSMQLS